MLNKEQSILFPVQSLSNHFLGSNTQIRTYHC